MATTLYLKDPDETGLVVAGYDEKQLSTVVGTGSGLGAYGGTPTTGGNHIEVIRFTNPVIWLYRVAAVTIAGTVSFAICGLESNMNDNVQPGVRIVRVSNAGSILSDVVANANAGHVPGSEFATTNGRKSWTATPTSTNFDDGDWIGIIVHGDAIGTMAAGSPAAWARIDGTNALVADSNVQFTEAITAYVEPTRTPPLLNISQAVPRASSW